MKMKRTLTAAIAAVALSACASPPRPDAALQIRETDTMLTIITAENPETQLMALVLTMSAKAGGEAPRILLCSAGGDLALKSPPPSATAPLKPNDASPQGMLKKLMNEGVPVDVCAIYLPNRPYGAEALLDGIGIAKPAEMGALIARPGETVLSF
jgi:predicted peroxiredoxin